MDLQAFLTNLLTLTAFCLPAFLVVAHIHREGWKLSPPVYAGMVGMLASFIMIARQSSFLDAQIAETTTGWFAKDTILAIILAFLAAMNLVVFDWIVPGLRQRLEIIPETIKSLAQGKSAVLSTTAFDLVPDHDDPSQPLAGPLLGIIWAAVSSIILIVVLAVYLLWPSIVITIDQHQIENTAAAKNRAEAVAERNQRNLKARATNVGAMANELVADLKRRADYCTTEKCATWSSSYLEKVIREIKGYGINLKGDTFTIKDFEQSLDSWDRVDALQDRLTAFAKERNAKLQSAKRPEATYKQTLTIRPTDIDVIAKENAQDTERLVDKLLTILAHPRDAMSMLTKDIVTAIAIAMELAAIAIAFFAATGRKPCAS